MKKARLLADYLVYQLKANGKYNIHSPFTYRFYTQVVKDKRHYRDYEEIEVLVRRLRSDRQLIETTDFGSHSGGQPYQTKYESVARLARTSSVQQKKGRLLYRIARTFDPATIVELGTSLGTSTMYLARGAPGASIYSLEGCASKATRAEKNFSKLGVPGVKMYIGHFDILLGQIMSSVGSIDLVFLDGNHRHKPTLHYFEQFMGKLNDNSIFILDDIRWSQGMKQAWMDIKAHPAVTVSIDLFGMGMVFFRKGLSKQDFLLRF